MPAKYDPVLGSEEPGTAPFLFAPRIFSQVICSSSAFCISSFAYSTSQPMRTFVVTICVAPSLESSKVTPVQLTYLASSFSPR